MVDLRDLSGDGWDETELRVKQAVVRIAAHHFNAGLFLGFVCGALMTLTVLFLVVISLSKG